MHKPLTWRCFLLLLLSWALPAPAAETPASLRDWRDFVLHGTESRVCPIGVNRVARQLRDRSCVWMYPFTFQLDGEGGRFEGRVEVYAESRVPLPGSAVDPPLAVTVDGRTVPVMIDSQPSILLPAGSHRIEGQFRWSRRPERLPLPAELALLDLQLNGKTIEPLERNAQGLWLGQARLMEPVRDALRLEVFRQISDGVPQELTTQLVLQVSGRAREETLGPALLPGLIPVALDGSLPARLEADGSLRVQVQPGRHELTLRARAVADTLVWTRPAPGAQWPAQEIWSYSAAPMLRVTEASGDSPIDPQQAGVPGNWADLPAFVLTAGQAVTLSVQSRGRADDANRLDLSRRLWLDFDGGGFTALDRIDGRMQSRWRLNLAAPFTLGSAAVAGEAVLVTRDEGGAAGVELRSADVALSAMSRLPRGGQLPVGGWSEALGKSELTLELPPGWRLLAAPGADRAYSTWIASWSLWNVFVVALTALLAYRAGGPLFGGAVLGYLLLSHGMPAAPRWLLLAAAGLLLMQNTLPAGWLARALRYGFAAVLLLLVLRALPFADATIRTALHPQLEQTRIRYGAEQLADAARHYSNRDEYGEELAPPPAPPAPPAPVMSQESDQMQEIEVTGARIKGGAQEYASPNTNINRGAIKQKYATGTVIQAGLPEPSWAWRSHQLGFDGPIGQDQQFRLVLMPPWLTRLWQLGCVLLLGAVIWRSAQLWHAAAPAVATPAPSAPGPTAPPGTIAASLLAAVLLTALLTPDARAQATPTPELLDRWREQLLRTPSCDNRCTRIAEARVRLEGNQLELLLEAHADTLISLPLPHDPAALSAVSVSVNGEAAPTRLEQGQLWAVLPRGVHGVVLRATLIGDQLALSFTEPPGRISVDAPGFDLTGIKDQRLQSGTLTLLRQLSAGASEAGTTGAQRSQQFPPFVRVDRQISLDLEWEIQTEVRRIAPSEGGFSVRIPLLAGERPSDGNVEAEQGPDGPVAVLSFAPGVSVLSFRSTLERAASLELTAPSLSQHAEVWSFNVGETWHTAFSGVPQRALDQDSSAASPVFDPLPGETLAVQIHRPEPLPGNSVAIDEVEYSIAPGPRSRTVALRFALRATQGGQHPLRLPAGIEVLAVNVDGQNQNLRPRDGVLTLPVRPGTQRVQIEWREDLPLGFNTTTLPVELGAEASNLAIRVELPASRWILAVGGPALGPAVLYWPKLLLLLLIAIGLARTGRTPLATGAWLLLATAFSTVFWPGLVLVASWFLALDARRRWNGGDHPVWFNTVQIGLLLMTICVLLAFAAAVPASLIGTPDMQIAGNGSSVAQLNWFADRSSGALPLVTVWSLPVLVWRLAMLAFALWLAFQLVSWLRWAWACVSVGGAWRALPRRPARPVRPERREQPEPPEAAATEPRTAHPASSADGEPPPLPGADVSTD